MAHEVKLGQILTGENFRDAVHIAVAPVVAGHQLMPGQDIGFLPDGTVGTCDKPLGIVDPYLNRVLRAGQQFYMFLYPQTITSLRHEWTHPDFENVVVEPPKSPVVEHYKAWMEEFAKTAGYSYDEVMAFGKEAYENGFYVERDREDLGYTLSSMGGPEKFWSAYEALTGNIKEDKSDIPFSCSC